MTASAAPRWMLRSPWLAAAALAVPVALLLVQAGRGLAVQQPLADVARLLVLSVAEEIVFRGGLQRGLLRWPAMARGVAGLSRANLATSAAFALAHLPVHDAPHALAMLPVSLLLGASLERSGRLALPCALHAWFNLALYGASWLAARPA